MNTQSLDVICLGRSSVDLYGEQVGGRLEDMQTFAKYVGGCPTNISVGTARLGLRSGLISRVGDEQMGRFIREYLNENGVDVSQVSIDPDRLTALVILGIRDRAAFPHIFYRENCADMAITPEHIDEGFIASSAALVVTGTHLSADSCRAATRRAIDFARKNQTRVVLDIDYRPVLWGLAEAQHGESRFVADDSVTQLLMQIIPDCDLVVGTEEEICIAGGTSDILDALKNLRSVTTATLVLKRGEKGCTIFSDEIPETIEAGLVVEGFPIEVFNTLGAGDAFMSGFLYGWLYHQPLEKCGRYGNACGAIVVSRHGCAPAMPNLEEVSIFLKAQNDTKPIPWPALDRQHRTTAFPNTPTEICALAFDHRSQMEKLAEETHSERDRISRFKELVAKGASQALQGDRSAGVIIDGKYGADVLPLFADGKWWVARPVELPGSRPLQFEAGEDLLAEMRTWPKRQIAKCLVSYHPDDNQALKDQQNEQLLKLHRACIASEHQLLLEVIPTADLPTDEFTLSQCLQELYRLGLAPEWWKLPPAKSSDAWDNIHKVIRDNDPHCRGVLILGLDAPEAELKKGFDLAAGFGFCRGFAVGRSVFMEPAKSWFSNEIEDEQVVERVAENYTRLVNLWRDRGR